MPSQMPWTLGATDTTMLKQAVYTGLILSTLFLRATFCLGQKEQTGSKLRLLIYGLAYNNEWQNAENVIGEKWGIEFYPVAGCVVSNKLVDSARNHNKQVEPLIENKFGKDRRKRFKKEVAGEFNTEKRVLALIDGVDDIKQLHKDRERDGDGALHRIMLPVANSTKYNVLIGGWVKLKGEDEWLTYYRLLVDYKTGDVQLLVDQPIKE